MRRVFVDRRVGGIERYYLAEKEDGVIVPDVIRKCVAFVYGHFSKGDLPVGTAFFVRFPMETAPGRIWIYAVTAKHVIDGIKARSVDQEVVLRMNHRHSGLVDMVTGAADWVTHPSDPSIDVAALAVTVARDSVQDVLLPPGAIVYNFPILEGSATREIIQEYQIGTGDEVFFPGMFVHHVGEKRNIPIVRIGNIAAMPEEPVQTKVLEPMEAYLVEARSIGGLSGSPVFVNIGLVRSVTGTVRTARPNPPYPTVFYMLGLMNGHFDVQPATPPLTNEKINMGIAIVTPVWRIMDVINHPREVEMRRKVEKEVRDGESSATLDSAPTEHEGVSREEFMKTLKRASQKISPPDQGKKGT